MICPSIFLSLQSSISWFFDALQTFYIIMFIDEQDYKFVHIVFMFILFFLLCNL